MNCSPRSLKLLDMPLLCQKLGFKTDVDGGRTTTNVDFGYNPKVLVGNWLERGWTDDEEVNKVMDLNTVYMKDYQHRPVQPDISSVWTNRLNAQGNIQLQQGKDDEFEHNKATIYDLSYRCKVRDLIDTNYGSATNYGKKECKQSYWDTQKDPRKFDRELRFHTEYKDNFSFNTCLSHALN